MSSTRQIAMRRTVCPRCGQRPGQECVTASGKRYPNLHSARTWPLDEAWGDGYVDGEAGAMSWALDSAKAGSETWERFVRRAERTILERKSAR